MVARLSKPAVVLIWMLAALSVLFSPLTHAQSTPLKTSDGFSVPQPGHPFQFPRDHGSHPDFKIEWWYLTGHLYAGSNRRFGFQATFFRQANGSTGATAETEKGADSPDFGYTQIYLAHFALTDVTAGRFYSQERLNREGWDASASTQALDVHNGSWSLRMTDDAPVKLALNGSIRAEAKLDLTFAAQKPLVIFGEDGVSRKGADPTAASYYLTFPRLSANGTVTLGDSRFQVEGEAWMDHEISSSQLSAQLVGWDWLSIQFLDRTELMLYRLRRRDGSADPASSCTRVLADGSLKRTAFEWDILDTWQSPTTKARYPSRVQLTIHRPSDGSAMRLLVEPLLKNQELAGQVDNIPYWEGACRVVDEKGHVLGSAYLELTGYAKDLHF